MGTTPRSLLTLLVRDVGYLNISGDDFIVVLGLENRRTLENTQTHVDFLKHCCPYTCRQDLEALGLPELPPPDVRATPSDTSIMSGKNAFLVGSVHIPDVEV